MALHFKFFALPGHGARVTSHEIKPQFPSNFIPAQPCTQSISIRYTLPAIRYLVFSTTQNSKFKTQNCELFISNNLRRGVQKSRIFSNISPYFSNIFEYFQTFLNIFERFRTFCQKTCAFDAKNCENLRVWCENPTLLRKNLRVWCEKLAHLVRIFWPIRQGSGQAGQGFLSLPVQLNRHNKNFNLLLNHL